MLYKLINLINENKNITQRKLSKELKISLGKVNEMIKKSVDMNYILKLNNNNNIQYEITEKGFKFLKERVSELRYDKIKINSDYDYKISNAVILAAGEKKEFKTAIASLDIEGVSVIKRTVNILKENGIKNIYVVVGYKKEDIKKSLENESNIYFIENDKYKWTGSMESLAQVKDYIKDDFILIEGDIVSEGQAINQILNYKSRECLLITNESGSGDEGFVQLKNNYLFKLGKDIHQFNRIDGEMIGISKISYKLFELMLEEYKDNINPYLNYEYILLDVAHNYKVPCLKIDDLAWGEIDNLDQYNRIINYTFPRIRRKDIISQKDNIKSIIEECLNLNEYNISEITRIGGMTNKNYKLRLNGELIILRLPGVGTEKLIDRSSENRNSQLVSEKNIDAKILYINEETGVKISKYIEGAETLTGRSAKKEENIKLVSRLLYKLHTSQIDMTNRFDVFKEIKKYENIIDENGYEYYLGYKNIRKKVFNIKELMIKHNMQIVPSHNDTLPDNFVKDRNGKMYLIDWEYSGLNDNMWDIAAHCLESNFSKSDEELFLSYYNDKIEKDDNIRLLMNKVLQDILWSLWTIIKENQGEDYGTYGIDRYKRGVENLNILYTLI